MAGRTFVGFGFGAIQGGLFAYEARRSGNFDRIVIAEVVPATIERVRRAGGAYTVQVATRTSLRTETVPGVELLHPELDRAALLEAIGDASELCTALPSVASFAPVAELLAAGLRTPCVVYTAENHNHAAEILEAAVRRHRSALPPCQFLNTVIGKMSGVGQDGFLVEEFNRILITKVVLPGFRRGIEVFEEKSDLLPFEEAKLYGHNAAHALFGYLAERQGLACLCEADAGLRAFVREAFVEESGPALRRRHAGVDPLFSVEGWRRYVDDLMERMANPWLRDAVARVIRDPARKLAWNDRLVGTMRLALDAGIQPVRFARGAAAARAKLGEGPTLEELWVADPDLPTGRKQQIQELIAHAT